MRRQLRQGDLKAKALELNIHESGDDQSTTGLLFKSESEEVVL